MVENEISQAELSRATEISRPTINRLVNGKDKTELNPEWAVQIGYALDLDPKTLYFGQEEEKIEEARSTVEVGSLKRLV